MPAKANARAAFFMEATSWYRFRLLQLDAGPSKRFTTPEQGGLITGDAGSRNAGRSLWF
jgi:hypothetical protein